MIMISLWGNLSWFKIPVLKGCQPEDQGSVLDSHGCGASYQRQRRHPLRSGPLYFFILCYTTFRIIGFCHRPMDSVPVNTLLSDDDFNQVTLCSDGYLLTH